MAAAVPRRPVGTICTFYSYKGGVGRTFALANVATTISLWGYRVLCVDWDLEAPGLHLFFDSITRERPDRGLVELIQAYGSGAHPDWREHLVDATHPDAKGRLTIMPAGRLDDDYVRRMQELNWLALYDEADLGTRLEELRDEWKAEYDFVLIDSRTGITDVGGICTVQLPDILVLVFTPNYQSVEGVADVVRRAEAQRERLPFDRARLIALPVVSRFEAGVKWAQEWLGIFEQRLDDIFGVWTHKAVSTSEMLNHTRVPYVADWSFGERLPVVEEGTRDPLTIGYAFETIAAMIAHRLESSELLVSNRQSYVDSARREGLLGAAVVPGYELDVLVSHGLPDRQTGLELANHLARHGFRTWPPAGSPPSIDISIEQWQDAFTRCRSVVALLSGRPTAWREEEYRQFVITTLSEEESRVLVPVLLSQSPEAIPSFLASTQGWISAFGRPLESVAQDIAERLWRNAAAAGSADAAFNLATLLSDRGETAEAEQLFERAAAAGHQVAALNLGLLLAARGESQAAVSWLRGSAEAGLPDAMLNLANVLNSLGMPNDAEFYYRSAAEAGNLEAAAYLATLLDIHGNPSEAAQWSRRRVAAVDAHIATVARKVVDGGVVLFLGSEINGGGHPGSSKTAGPPGTRDLARDLAERFGADPRDDLAAIAQHVSETQGTNHLNAELHRIFTQDYEPTLVHCALPALRPRFEVAGRRVRPLLILTLNYDDALERTFEDVAEPYDVITYLAEERGRFLHRPWGNQPRVIGDPTRYLELAIEERVTIVKLLGSVDRADTRLNWESFVVTEDQFDDYLIRAHTSQLLPFQLAARLGQSRVLFLGVGAEDRNVRSVVRRVLGSSRLRESWAVQPQVSAAARQFWQSNGVEMLEVPLDDYLEALRGQIGVLAFEDEPRRS